MKLQWILITIIFLLTANTQANQANNMQLFSQDKVYKNLIVLKIKDQFNPILTQGVLTVGDQTLFSSTSNLAVSSIFNRGKEVYQQQRALAPQGVKRAHLENYYYLEFKNNLSPFQADSFLQTIATQPFIEFAYFQPKFEDAVITQEPYLVLAPLPDHPEGEETPLFTEHQFYLKESPEGVDAFYAWTLEGGTGKNIKVIDIETNWYVNHEDVKEPFFTKIVNGDKWGDHGTAVWGIVAAQNDDKGVTGIAYDVDFGVSGVKWEGSFIGYYDNVARAIDLATAELTAGDVMIIEQHAPGPNNESYTAVEYWPVIFDAIRAASDKGIYVVAAAGNGYSDLDHEDYEGAFDRELRDSGSIIVGAAGSPRGTRHLRKLGFSNFGSRIDAFGYGEDVATAGYGDLFNQSHERSYTNSFSGTSSATPIVSGVVASLSGHLKTREIILTPDEMRSLLRNSGTKQKDNPDGNFIGSLPNYKELIDQVKDMESPDQSNLQN